MGCQVHLEARGSRVALVNQDQQGHLEKGEMSAHQVCPVRGNQARMASRDRQDYQEGRATQDPLVCLGSQVCLASVSRGSPDQRVIKEWEVSLEDQGQKEIKDTVVCPECLDPLELMAHLVAPGLWVPLGELVALDPKGMVERQGRRGLKEVWVSPDLLACLVRMASQEKEGSQDPEDHLVPQGLKEKVDTKGSQASLEVQACRD